MFDILLEHVLRSQLPAIQEDNDDDDDGDDVQPKDEIREIMSREQKWIVEEFVRVYGISRSYYKLTLLRCLTGRLDLLVSGSNILKDIIEYLTSREDLTSEETDMLSEACKAIMEKLWLVLTNFTKFFPRNRPRGAFSSFMHLFCQLKIKYEGLKESEVEQIVKQIAKEAINNDYDSIDLSKARTSSDGMSQETARLCTICRSLRQKLRNMEYFTRDFDISVDFPRLCVRVYYEQQFIKDLEELLLDISKHPKREGDAFGVLQLCYDIQQLNTLLREDYEDAVLSSRLIDASALGKKYLDGFIDVLRNRLSRIMRSAVAMEKPLQGVFHTTSVVDLFCAANQFFEVLKGLDFVSVDLLHQYGQVLQEIVIDYARHNETLCNEALRIKGEKQEKAGRKKGNRKGLKVILDFTANLVKGESATSDEFLITQDFVHKLNNIAASRQQLNVMIESIEEENNRFFEEQFEEEYYMINDDDDDDNDFLLNSDEGDEEEDDIKERLDTASHQDTHGSEVNDDDVEDLGPEKRQIQTTFTELNSILTNILDMLCSQFKPAIHRMLISVADMAKNISSVTEEVSTRYIFITGTHI